MKPTYAFVGNLSLFTALVEKESNDARWRQYNGVLPDEQVRNSTPGPKFVRVYFESAGRSGKSVRYFVRVADGAIFAANGWKVPNLNRQFGRLDTINEFDWSGYEGRSKPDSQFKMVPTVHPYATAVFK
jgi:hypothetical protein